MKFKLFLLAILIGLGGCKGDIVEIQYRQYELVKVKNDKYFYVDLRDTETGEETGKLMVGPHCGYWEKAVIGEVFALEKITYQNPNGGRVTKVNLKGFCNFLRDRS